MDNKSYAYDQCHTQSGKLAEVGQNWSNMVNGQIILSADLTTFDQLTLKYICNQGAFAVHFTLAENLISCILYTSMLSLTCTGVVLGVLDTC